MPDRSRLITFIAVLSTLLLALSLATPSVADEHEDTDAGSATGDRVADRHPGGEHERADSEREPRRDVRLRRILGNDDLDMAVMLRASGLRRAFGHADHSDQPRRAMGIGRMLRRSDRPARRSGGIGRRGPARRSPVALRERSFSVYHGPLEVTLTTTGSDGHRLGDLRVAATETTLRDGRAAGRLDATLTTTAIDVPNEGDEVRIGSLIFSFGDDLGSQIVVDGTATYPAEGPTLAAGTVAVRPVVGGSGRFGGATGSARSTHLEDGTWEHTFMLSNGAARSVAVGSDRVRPGVVRTPFRLRPRGAARVQPGEALRMIRALVTSARREAREAMRGSRTARKADAKEAKRAEKAARQARKAEASAGDGITVVKGAGTDGTASEEVGIIRIDLGLAEPGSAPGDQLGLWQYAIPAGSELVPHTHPGWQIARIARGELEYTVVAGEGTIIHEDGSTTSIGPGTYVLATGDSVVENPDLEHLGANRTDDEVVIIAATLYEMGAPLAIPLDEPAEQPAA